MKRQINKKFHLRHPIQLCFFMLDFLFNELFLLFTQVHLVHLDHEFVPSLLLLNLFVLLPSILRLYISFDTFSALSRAISWLYLLTCGCDRLLLGSCILLLLSLLLLRLASDILHPTQSTHENTKMV